MLARGNVFRRLVPFTFAHPFRYQVTAADTEEGTVRLGGDGFGKIGLSRTWRAVE